MLAIRYLRSGRTNKAFFRIVLTESSKPSKSGFIKVLGWYNPHTKENSLSKEEIIKWLDQGAQASNSVSKLLNDNGIKHKGANFVKSNPRPKKGKEEQEPKKSVNSEEVSEEAQADSDQTETPAEITEAEVAKEVTQEPTEETKTPSGAEE